MDKRPCPSDERHPSPHKDLRTHSPSSNINSTQLPIPFSKSKFHGRSKAEVMPSGIPSAKRAKAATEYAAATQPGIPEQTPLSTLVKAMHDHHDKIFPQNGNVIHWFRSDLRVEDNRALHAASQRAKENRKGLIALYVVSPQVSSVERPTLITRTGDTTRQPPFE